MELKAKLIKMIIEKSFRYSEEEIFKLASGRTSNYYFNCKPTTLNPEGMNLTGEIIFDMVKDLKITASGGLTLGADPISNALAVISFQKGKPIKSFIVRKEAKGHGTKSPIEGDVVAGERVLILDDVITTGGSTIIAIEKVREAGLIVADVIALIDREEGGKENIQALGVPVRAVLTRSEIMDVYKKRLSPSDL
ncbi:MAG: orotate phosphoribosyltransferase [Deltaproteobacteria bacterium]